MHDCVHALNKANDGRLGIEIHSPHEASWMTTFPPSNAKPIRVPSFGGAGKAVLFSRGLVIVSSIATSILLPLILDQTSVGQFFLAQIIIAGLSTVAQLGLIFSIPATVTEAVAIGDLGRARVLAVKALALAACTGLLVAAVAWLTLPSLGSRIGMESLSAWITVTPIIAAIVPLMALSTLLVELLRGIHAIRASASLAAVTGTFMAFTLTLLFANGIATDLSGVLQIVLIGSAICLLIGVPLATRAMSGWKVPALKTVSSSQILRHTLPNLLTTLVFFALAQLDILLLSALGTMNDVAEYGIALRFSAVLLVPLGIANAAFTPLAVQARSTSDETAVHDMMSKLVTISAALSAMFYVGFAFAGYTLIVFWNPNYVDSYTLTLILGVGQVVHAGGGSAGVFHGLGRSASGHAHHACYGPCHRCPVPCRAALRWRVSGLRLEQPQATSFKCRCFVYRVRRRFKLDPWLLGVLSQWWFAEKPSA